VFSGAAAVAIAIRRLALGLHLPSGRRYVDIDLLIAEPTYEATAEVPLVTYGNLPSAGRFSPSVQVILESAAQAPSGGNCQPWRFSVEGDFIFVFRDESRSKGLRDWNSLASLFAIGAAIENAVIAAQELGHLAEVILFPQRGRMGLIASIEIARHVEPPFPADGSAQIDLIAKRATNRKLGDGSPLSQKEMIFLSAAAKHADNSLELIQDTEARIQVGRILGAFDRIQLTVPELNREVVSELRWTQEEVDYKRDGIDVGSLELSVSETCALKLIARPDVASILREPGRGVILEEAAVKAMSSSSAVGLLRTRSVTPASFVQSGRSFQRLWLEATRVGLWIQPWTALTFVARIVDLQDGTIFTDKEKREIRRLRERLDDVFSHQQGWAQVLVFRVFRAPPGSRRSLRRTLDDTVEWTNSAA
jgi:hypothetical protein